MAKYTLPKPKKDKKSDSPMAAPDDWSWRRRLTIPVNAEILGYAEVGEELAVTLKGKVTGMSMNKNGDNASHDITLDVSSVECK